MNLERFQDALTKPGKKYTADDLSSENTCKTRQRDLSRQLTVLIDVLYALVLVGGAEAYRSLFTMGGEFQHPSRFLPVTLALGLIYFTAIHSFIDYHLAAEDQPYQLLNTRKRKWDLTRFYLDILIVGLYSFALLKSHVLLSSPGANLAPVFFTFFAIFVLFIIWGWFRRQTAPEKDHQPYSPRLLFLCVVLYLLLAIVYSQTSNGWGGNSVFLAIALLIMMFYRWMNWRQNRWCADS